MLVRVQPCQLNQQRTARPIGAGILMRIAIDFDETLTLDAALWRGFVSLCEAGGHSIVCVTARRDTDENRETLSEWMESHGIILPVYFTGLGSKIDYMTRRSIKVDIWIDDDPRKCALGH